MFYAFSCSYHSLVIWDAFNSYVDQYNIDSITIERNYSHFRQKCGSKLSGVKFQEFPLLLDILTSALYSFLHLLEIVLYVGSQLALSIFILSRQWIWDFGKKDARTQHVYYVRNTHFRKFPEFDTNDCKENKEFTTVDISIK